MRAAILLSALALSASVAHAQARTQSASRSRDKDVTLRELLQIEEAIAKANRDCDYRYFDRIEADEFIFTDNAGGVTTKKEDLAGEKDCRKSTNAQALDEPRLQIQGDVAILNARTTTTGTNNAGQPFTRRARFTDVFVWRDGRWQLVVGHSSRIPDAPR